MLFTPEVARDWGRSVGVLLSWGGECQRNMIVTCTVYCVLCCVMHGRSRSGDINGGSGRHTPVRRGWGMNMDAIPLWRVREQQTNTTVTCAVLCVMCNAGSEPLWRYHWGRHANYLLNSTSVRGTSLSPILHCVMSNMIHGRIFSGSITFLGLPCI